MVRVINKTIPTFPEFRRRVIARSWGALRKRMQDGAFDPAQTDSLLTALKDFYHKVMSLAAMAKSYETEHRERLGNLLASWNEVYRREYGEASGPPNERSVRFAPKEAK